MELKDYLYKETIECLPSTDLREHLISFQMNLSLMQKATIIDRFAKPTDKIVLFKRLAEFTPSTNERDLLLCAVDDIKNRGYVDTATVELYNARIPHEGPPLNYVTSRNCSRSTICFVIKEKYMMWCQLRKALITVTFLMNAIFATPWLEKVMSIFTMVRQKEHLTKKSSKLCSKGSLPQLKKDLMILKKEEYDLPRRF